MLLVAFGNVKPNFTCKFDAMWYDPMDLAEQKASYPGLQVFRHRISQRRVCGPAFSSSPLSTNTCVYSSELQKLSPLARGTMYIKLPTFCLTSNSARSVSTCIVGASDRQLDVDMLILEVRVVWSAVPLRPFSSF